MTISSANDDSIVTPWVILQLGQFNHFLEVEEGRDIARHLDSDLQRVGTLGSGGFCDVSLVISKSTKKKMAMKQLNPLKIQSTSKFLTAASDVLTEVCFLVQLDHPNIIKLHGITASPVADAFEGDGSGFFFTMDVMEETLTDRLRRWRSDEKHFKKRRGIRKMLCRNKKNAQILRMYSRLETSALGVAKAMSHIHEHRILHRDLKSSNIGFHSETGQVCLFDFGLAKKLDQCDNNEICVAQFDTWHQK